MRKRFFIVNELDGDGYEIIVFQKFGKQLVWCFLSILVLKVWKYSGYGNIGGVKFQDLDCMIFRLLLLNGKDDLIYQL